MRASSSLDLMPTETVTFETKEPDWKNVQRVAAVLGVPTAFLMKGRVPDDVTPSQAQRVCSILLTEHVDARAWGKRRRNAILGSLIGQYITTTLIEQ